MRMLVAVLAFFPWVDSALLPWRWWDEVLLLACLLAAPLRPLLPWSAAAFFALHLASIAAHQVPLGIAVDALRVAFQPMLWAVATVSLLRDPDRRREFVDLTVACGVAVAAGAVAQYALGAESPRWTNKPWIPQFRAVSVFANPNALAAWLNLVLALALAHAWFEPDPRRRAAYAGSSVLLAAALVLTFSRGGWLGFGAMALAGAAVLRVRAVVVLVPALAVLLLAPSCVSERAGRLLEPAYYRQSASSGRLANWMEASARVAADPLLGAGPGGAGGSVAHLYGRAQGVWVDNQFLKVAAETGLPGLAAFLALLAALAGRALRSRDRAAGLAFLGGLVAVGVQSLTAEVLEALYVGVLFWAMAGMVLEA